MKQQGKEVKQFSNLQITAMNLVKGGIAGCLATTTVIPLDVTKTWMQLQSESGVGNIKIMDAMSGILKSKGMPGFYSGLDSALVRQFCFASIRVGLFFNAVDLAQKRLRRNLSLAEKAAVSATVGAVGAFVINPFDVVMVRAWADVKRPVNERRNYKNIFDGLIRITREEGFTTLWRASTPNIIRAVGLNLGMMTPYQELKERLKPFLGDTLANHAVSSTIAGICATLLALPFDNIKVKLVSMRPDAKGNMPYKGVVDCLLRSVRKEGILRLWAGLIPVAANLGPHSVIVLLASEYIRKLMVKNSLLP